MPWTLTLVINLTLRPSTDCLSLFATVRLESDIIQASKTSTTRQYSYTTAELLDNELIN